MKKQAIVIMVTLGYLAVAAQQTPLTAVNNGSAAKAAKMSNPAVTVQNQQGPVYAIGNLPASDTTPSVNFRDVDIVAFKNLQEWNDYYATRYRVIKVLPYVKIAKQIYDELEAKEADSKKGVYRHYRKDLEKEMRARFEKELKDLTTSEGKILFKLINRETGNNCYTLIRDVKNPVTAWFYQTLGKHWGYDLKENYDPNKEKMIETVIKQLGPAYNVSG
ncbi:MAG TPA: DUF4294 domain-containing protein [Chitinophagales bacterium]|nr:DUF4294 domain-containing protein [Chitinophagales bacterium]